MVNAVKRLKRPKQITIEGWERILGCSRRLPMMDFCLIFARREKMITCVYVEEKVQLKQVSEVGDELSCRSLGKLTNCWLSSSVQTRPSISFLSFSNSLSPFLSLSRSLSMFNLYPSPAHQLFDRIPLVKSSLLIHCQIPPSSFLSLFLYPLREGEREREKGLSSARERKKINWRDKKKKNFVHALSVLTFPSIPKYSMFTRLHTWRVIN